jgi:hypothetical protein
MTLEYRPPAPFPAVAPRLSPRLPAQQPPIRVADPPSNSHSLCIFTQIRANSVFDNAFALNWMQVPANASLCAMPLDLNTLCTLLSSSKEQASCFHGLARSSSALLPKSENQLLCFQPRARSFVDMWGWRAPELRYPPHRPPKQHQQPARSMFCLPSAQFSGTLPRPSPPRGGRKRDPGGTP